MALLFFLGQQPFGYGPRAKRSRSATRAGLAGYLFETAHNAFAPIWQPGAYMRSRELGSVVEGAHSNFAHEAKGWLEHESVMPRKLANVIAVPVSRGRTLE